MLVVWVNWRFICSMSRKKKNTEKQDYSKPTKSTGGKADVSLSLADNPKEQRLKQVTCWHYITGKDLGQGRGMENY